MDAARRTAAYSLPAEAFSADSNHLSNDLFPWYALCIRQRFRLDCEEYLKTHAYDYFSPVKAELRQWSDRRKIVHIPLFPGYIFCRFNPREGMPIWHAPGVIGIINSGGKLLEVDGEQIENVKRCLATSMPIDVVPELICGRKVQVIAGPLAGICGVLAYVKQQLRVALEITMMNRTILVEVHASHLAAI